METAYLSSLLESERRMCISQLFATGISGIVLTRVIIYTVIGSITIFLSNNGLSGQEVFKDIDNTLIPSLKGKGCIEDI